MQTLTPNAKRRITEAVSFKVWETGLDDNKEVKALLVTLVPVIQRIILEDISVGKPTQPANS